MSEGKRLLGPMEWLALLLGLGILMYLLFQKGGVTMFERTEQVEFIDPSDSHQPLPPKRGPSASEIEVDRLLRQMATNFKNGEEDTGTANDIGQQWGLSAEEVRFYRRIRDSYQLDDRLESANDWLQLLRGARSTYHRVQDLIDELSPQQQRGSSPDQILENEAASHDFFTRLAEWYDLSVEELEAFARHENRGLEDWALFLAQKGKGR